MSQLSVNDLKKGLKDDPSLAGLSRYFESLSLDDPISLASPYNLLSPQVIQFLEEFIGQQTEQDIIQFSYATFRDYTKHPQSGNGLYVLHQIMIKHFVETIAESVKEIKSELMRGPKVSDQFTKMMLDTIHQTYLVNPHIGLYCWFELILPLVLNSKSESEMIENCIKFVEDMFTVYTVEQFKSASVGIQKEYHAKDTLIALIQFLSKYPSSSIARRLSSHLAYIKEVTLFYSKSATEDFFSILYSQFGQKSSAEMCLSFGVACIMKHLECIQLVITNYKTHIPQTNNLIFYLSLHWKSLSKSATNPTAFKIAKELMNMLDHINKVNIELFNSKEQQKGSPDKSVICTTGGSSYALQAAIESTIEEGEKGENRKKIWLQRVLYYSAISFLFVFVCHKQGYIPTEYDKEVTQFFVSLGLDNNIV